MHFTQNTVFSDEALLPHRNQNLQIKPVLLGIDAHCPIILVYRITNTLKTVSMAAFFFFGRDQMSFLVGKGILIIIFKPQD